MAHMAICACRKTHVVANTTTTFYFISNHPYLGLIVGETEVSNHQHIGVVPTAGAGEPQKVVFVVAVKIDYSLKHMLHLMPTTCDMSKKGLWRAGYTPADRQTSRGVLHHTAQYLYSACI